MKVTHFFANYSDFVNRDAELIRNCGNLVGPSKCSQKLLDAFILSPIGIPFFRRVAVSTLLYYLNEIAYSILIPKKTALCYRNLGMFTHRYSA